jgi:hypothetical protein
MSIQPELKWMNEWWVNNATIHSTRWLVNIRPDVGVNGSLCSDCNSWKCVLIHRINLFIIKFILWRSDFLFTRIICIGLTGLRSSSHNCSLIYILCKSRLILFVECLIKTGKELKHKVEIAIIPSYKSMALRYSKNKSVLF